VGLKPKNLNFIEATLPFVILTAWEWECLIKSMKIPKDPIFSKDHQPHQENKLLNIAKV